MKEHDFEPDEQANLEQGEAFVAEAIQQRWRVIVTGLQSLRREQRDRFVKQMREDLDRIDETGEKLSY